MKNIEPEDVANAIVDALESPKFDVHVPKSAGVVGKVMSLVPRKGREAIAKAMRADQIMVDYDKAGRAAYEARIATNAPASDARAAAAEQEEAEEKAVS
jgi:hypothetical protein